jgi:XTP/dITP diphosphohydrolase
MQLVFATNNLNKIKEIKHLLNNSVEVLGLSEINFAEEIPETGITIKENALQKAKYINNILGYNCFADDTGLEVQALNGMPGVYSARYAGLNNDANKNIDKLLNELKNTTNLNARFVTVIALILNGQEFFFEGVITGKISKERRGVAGFGYDPVFIPDGYNISFAEMSLEQKNKISHRSIATQKMIEFLNKKSI